MLRAAVRQPPPAHRRCRGQRRGRRRAVAARAGSDGRGPAAAGDPFGMAAVYESFAQRAIELQRAKGGRVLVGLAGSPGSGKSTSAAGVVGHINAELGAGTAVVLPMDGFHLYRAELDAMPDPAEAHRRRGAHWTFDGEAFVRKVREVRADDGIVMAPGFDHGTGDPVEGAIAVGEGAEIVIVEGNYVLLDEPPWSALGELFDEAWFVDCDVDTAMARVVKRHLSVGRSLEQATLRVDTNDRPNALEILATKERADVFVPSCGGPNTLPPPTFLDE